MPNHQWRLVAFTCWRFHTAGKEWFNQRGPMPQINVSRELDLLFGTKPLPEPRNVNLLSLRNKFQRILKTNSDIFSDEMHLNVPFHHSPCHYACRWIVDQWGTKYEIRTYGTSDCKSLTFPTHYRRRRIPKCTGRWAEYNRCWNHLILVYADWLQGVGVQSKTWR